MRLVKITIFPGKKWLLVSGSQAGLIHLVGYARFSVVKSLPLDFGDWHFWMQYSECWKGSHRSPVLPSNLRRRDSAMQHISNYFIHTQKKSGVRNLIYYKSEKSRGSGSIRHRCWYASDFRDDHLFNILHCFQAGFLCGLSIQAAMTNRPRWGGLKNELYLSQFRRPGSPISRHQQKWCRLRAQLLVCIWPYYCCALAWWRGEGSEWRGGEK